MNVVCFLSQVIRELTINKYWNILYKQTNFIKTSMFIRFPSSGKIYARDSELMAPVASLAYTEISTAPDGC
jgi:hypothetical protein